MPVGNAGAVVIPDAAIPRQIISFDGPAEAETQELWALGKIVGPLGVIAFAGTLIMFLIRAHVGLTTLEFGDETEKFVAAVMIRHGLRLYKDIFANHGPLAYLLAWLITFVTGTEDFSKGRLVVVALAFAACTAVATSPALGRGYIARFWAAALFLAPLSALWFVHPLHMLIYHAISGYLMTIVLAQLVLPAIAGVHIERFGAFASGASAMLAIATGYPEAVPACLCILTATVAIYANRGWVQTREMLFMLAIGSLVTALPLLAWITLYADWSGLFVNHFYFNQMIYGPMIGYSPWNVFHGIVFSLSPANRVHTFALVMGIFGLIGAWRRRLPGRVGRFVGIGLAGAAVLMLNPKGSSDFPDSAEIIASCALLAIALAARLGRANGARLIGGLTAALAVVIAGEVVARTALISPHGMLRSEATIAVLRPDPSDPVSVEVQRLVHPDETFLALPFMAASYLNAQRLPASGYYYYLPFQAEYDRAPIMDRRIDLCGDIERVRPPVILLADFPVGIWGPISHYKPCIAEELAHDYSPLPTIPFVYVRRDRLP